MTRNVIIGLALAAVGIVLLVLGSNATNTAGEQITQSVTGHYTDQTVWFIVGGVAALVAGGGLSLFALRKTHH